MTTEMTDEELRIKVAELCGWTAEEDDEGFWRAFSPSGIMQFEKWISRRNVLNAGFPDYPRDLNAMREAVVTLSVMDYARYARALKEVTGFGGHSIRVRNDRLLLEATARQRARAFVATMCR